MAETNRRSFLRTASLGAVAVGAASAVPGAVLAGTAHAEPAARAKQLDGPVVLLLRDASTGEFTVMHGEQSSTLTDKALAARLTHEAPTAQL
ncbi:twin-arginine translocation signal domain-containing protein [Rhodococcus sp. X156]|uniref:twin-arginine translocation signal domain-containing protein n=1 Tax=Rhodococcus sp. X156 TaxID=2499145 RepID=UPI000FDAB1BE|nr:twin-arginine translocation signal domain-containing protein [Rhodococcus sp. X156]